MLQGYVQRIAMQDTVVGDVAVPKGTVVWVSPIVVRDSNHSSIAWCQHRMCVRHMDVLRERSFMCNI